MPMIPFPKTKTSAEPLLGAGDLDLSGETPHLLVEASAHALTLESLIDDPEATGLALSSSVQPPTFSRLAVGAPSRDFIKWECPPTGLRVKLYELQNQIRIIGDRKARAYRSMRLAYIKQIRRELSKLVPIKHAYVPEKVTKTIVYYRRLKIAFSTGLLAAGWVDVLDLTYEQVKKIEAQNEAAGPFDSRRSAYIRVRVLKTITYTKKVRIPVEFKRINPPKEVVNAGLAKWTRANPPYSRRNDPELLQLRAERDRLKLQLAQHWNACLAVKRRGTFRWLSKRPDGKGNVVMTNPDPLLTTLSRVFSAAGRLTAGAIFPGYNWFGRPNHLGFAVGDRPDSVAPSKWEAVARWSPRGSYGDIGRPSDQNTLALFRGQPSWKVNDAAASNSAYADAMLSLSSGDIHDSEHFNVLRSVGELKDTRSTFKAAREFLRWILGKPLKATTSLGSAAAAYLTYRFGIKPTAEDIGRLLGSSRDLMFRVDDNLATVSRVARLTSQQLFSVRKYVRIDDREAIEKDLFDPNPPPLIWRTEVLASHYHSEVGIRYWDVPYGMFWDGGHVTSGSANVPVTHVGLDGRYVMNSRCEARLPQFVWLPRKPLVFCRYATDHVKAALDGANFMDYYGSVLPVSTAWELTPLSFVIDWFFTTEAVAKSLDQFIKAAELDLVATEDGFWHSSPLDLYLVVPKWDNPSHEVVTQFRGTPSGYGWDSSNYCRRVYEYAAVTVEELTPLQYAGATWLKTGCTTYTRGPLRVHPLMALMPRLRVRLNQGKVGSLLAMLTSNLGR